MLALLAMAIRLFLPGWLRSTIQSQATAQLGLPVQIERLGLSVTGGRLTLHGISVSPHEGIGGRDVLTIGQLSVNIRWRSLLSRQIDIEEFLLHDVDFLALREEGGTRNIGPFLDRYRKKKQPKTPRTAPEQVDPQRTPETPPVAPPEVATPMERAPGALWTVRIRRAQIRNVSALVRSEGEPSRQTGFASATLGEIVIADMEWPSSGGSGTVKVNDFTLDGIGGRWEGTRILALEGATVTGRMLPGELIIEDALLQKPFYRQSWDHLTRDQISRTEDLLDLVFSARDSDFIKTEESEEEPGPELDVEIAEVTPEPIELLESAELSRSGLVASDGIEQRSRRRSKFTTDIRRFRMVDADWVRQTRINGTWTDVVTSFDLEIRREGSITNTTVTGRSSYEDSQFDVRYGVDEEEDRSIYINARRMPFHQMFWGETIKDERIPRVEHVLYDLNVDVTHHKGVLLGQGLASFSEVQVTPDRRPFWQRVSLKGGGWATILSELAHPETGASRPIPFEVERPLLEFNFFVLYTELQAAFDLARLAMVDLDNGPAE